MLARYPEGVKTSGWVAAGIGAVVLAGGGIWAATTLPARDEATEPETAYTGSYEPVETETPEPSAEPTEAVETPDVEPEPEETVTPEYSELEQTFLSWGRPILSGYGEPWSELSDEEMFSYLSIACQITSGTIPNQPVVPGTAESDAYGNYTDGSTEAEINASHVDVFFIDAAQLGPDGANGDATYCEEPHIAAM